MLLKVFVFLYGGVIYLLQGVVRPSDKVSLFGEMDGYGFFDNSFYYLTLFGESKNNHKNIWITRSRAVKKYCKKYNIECHYWLSLPGLYYCVRARNFYVTHGYKGNDITPFIREDRVLTCFWHGVPFKSMHKWNPPRGLVKFLMRRKKFPDVFYCQSEYDRDIFVSLGLPSDSVLFRPYPRLYAQNLQKNDWGLIEKKYALHLPTFRKRDEGFFSESITAALHEEFKSSGYDYYLKCHPYHVNCHDMCRQNFTKEEWWDTNSLLLHAHILITDYSSVVIDFLIYNRPIIIYAPDIDEYEVDRGGKFHTRDFLCAGPLCRTVDELNQCLVTREFESRKYKENRRKLLDTYLPHYVE